MNPRKLSEEAVAEIRQWHAARSVSQDGLPRPKEIRQRHGVSSSLLSKICRGIRYKARRAAKC